MITTERLKEMQRVELQLAARVSHPVVKMVALEYAEAVGELLARRALEEARAATPSICYGGGMSAENVRDPA